MNEFLHFALLGLALGTIYALAAQGLVVVYRGSGVLNLAHGAMALFGAAWYVWFTGSDTISVFDIFETTGPGWPQWAGFVAAVAMTATVGLLTHWLVMRPLRGASPLARLVATLGLLGLLQSYVLIFMYPADQFRLVDGFFPSTTIDASSPVLNVPWDRIWLIGISIVMTAALWGVYRFTAFGRSTSAVAENQRSASTAGISPDFVAGLNWALGAALAAVAAILILPIANFSPLTLSLLILNALAAALVGGFESFPMTLVGGLIIGVGIALAQHYITDPGWSQAPEALPFLAIIIVLVVRGRALPLRGFLMERLPRVGRTHMRPWLVALISLAIAVPIVSFVLTENAIAAVTTSAASAIICLSLVVVTGLAGQVSLAQYALAGLGAFFSARLVTQDGLFGSRLFSGWPFELSALFTIVLVAAIGLVFALPSLRTRGVNLAIATLGFAVAVQKLILVNPDYIGGYAGTQVPPPKLLGWDIYSVPHPARYAVVSVVVLAVFGLAVANMRRGRTGRRLIATRANERAAASLGVSVFGAKLYAFSLGAAIAAAAGVLLAFRVPQVTFDTYTPFASINIVVNAFIGGIGYISGAMIGGAIALGGFINYAIEQVISFSNYFTLFTSFLLLITVIFNADGVARGFAVFSERIRHRFARAAARADAAPHERVVERCSPRTLAVEGLGVSFGGVIALQDVDVRVGPGEVVGLIGPNGAGKTTLIDAVTGFSRASKGVVRIDDVALRGSPRARAQLGINRTFQSLELFDDMTVRDNLRVACDTRDKRAYLTDLFWPKSPPLTPQAEQALDDFELRDDLDRTPRELSFGKRRLLAIARAVAGGPSILLLDEPAAGLDESETQELGRLVRRLAEDWGIAVLMVEHDMGLVMSVSDRVVVLDFGTLLTTGTPAEVRSDPRVVAAYLGDADADADGEGGDAGSTAPAGVTG